MKFQFTIVENNKVFLSWQAANPDAKIYSMQFVPAHSTVEAGMEVGYTHHLGIVYTIDAVTE